jgi:hypothetical protein
MPIFVIYCDHFKEKTTKPTLGSWQSTRKPRTNIKIGSLRERGGEEQKNKGERMEIFSLVWVC